MSNTPIRLRFAGTTEVFTAPKAFDLSRAIYWLGRLNHSTIHRVKKLGETVYLCDNNRRGVNKRSCVIEVVS